jgi:hypothetical protein
MWNYTLSGDFFKIGWRFLDAVYNIDPITIACYRSGREVVDNVYKNAFLINPRTLIDNVVFNFG